jgi:hypothetical protein
LIESRRMVAMIASTLSGVCARAPDILKAAVNIIKEQSTVQKRMIMVDLASSV